MQKLRFWRSHFKMRTEMIFYITSNKMHVSPGELHPVALHRKLQSKSRVIVQKNLSTPEVS